MIEEPRRRCPWCANPGGCLGCSFSGDDPSTYVLVSEAEASRRVRLARRPLLVTVALLVGALLALLALFALLAAGALAYQG